mgnify:CR=1 FL=1
MRKTISILAMALSCAFAVAQTNQVVWLNGKVLYGHPITTIDSITYDMTGMLEGDTLSLILPRSTRYVVHDTVTVVKKDTVYIDVCGSAEATVATSAVTHATYNSLALGGMVRFSDYDAVTERGICHPYCTYYGRQCRKGRQGNRYFYGYDNGADRENAILFACLCSQ